MWGIIFYLKPDFTTVKLKTLAVALGQVFFSLSLGMGTLITYGSYLSDKENLYKSSMIIAGLDPFVSLISGFAILPAVFSFSMTPNFGPKLMFITLPQIFNKMQGGRWYGLLFFILVLFAAITSVISLMEVIITFFIEKYKTSRKKASFITGLILFLLSSLSSLSFGILNDFKILGSTIFDFFDLLSSNVLLPIGGFFICFIVGYIWKPKNALYEITNKKDLPFKLKNIWVFLIKYVLPLFIILIILNNLNIIK